LIANGEAATRPTVQRRLDPLRQHGSSVLDWVIANRDGLVVGVMVAAIMVALMLLVRVIGARLVRSEDASERFGWRSVIGSVLAKTSIFFMIATAVDVVAHYVEPPERALHVVDAIFIIGFALQGAIWARELILAMIARRIGNEDRNPALGNASAIIRVLVSVALFAIAIVVILDNLGVNVTALVAGLGIGGIAIGLAAQGIFSDLFAALSILFDKPFKRGDTISYGGRIDQGATTGTVERIGLKTTRIRSRTGELVIMANTKLLEQELTNIDEARQIRVWLPFSVVYQTDPDVLARMAEIVAPAFEGLKGVKMVRCTVNAFAPSGVDFNLVYDDRSHEFDSRALNKSALCLGILRIFKNQGIDFAYPTQTTFTAAPDGTLVMPYGTAPAAPPPKR
jgi:small-conductance mechanosensitive channel